MISPRGIWCRIIPTGYEPTGSRYDGCLTKHEPFVGDLQPKQEIIPGGRGTTGKAAHVHAPQYAHHNGMDKIMWKR